MNMTVFRPMPVRLRLLAPFALFLLLSACSTVQPYPEGWGRPQSGLPECTAVAGSYANRGAWSEGTERNDSPMLSDYLGFGRMADPNAEATRFELSFPGPGEFRVVGSRDGAVVRQRAMSAAKGEYACEEGGIVLGGSRSVRENIAGVESWKYTFSRNETGDLVVRGQESGFGLVFLLVPVGGSNTFWMRFPELPEGTAR